MGRTIPSYRIVSEIEILKWRPFRKLLDKQDRKIYDETFSYSRLYNVAWTMACRLVLIHTILMSIIFEHYKKLSKIISHRHGDWWEKESVWLYDGQDTIIGPTSRWCISVTIKDKIDVYIALFCDIMLRFDWRQRLVSSHRLLFGFSAFVIIFNRLLRIYCLARSGNKIMIMPWIPPWSGNWGSNFLIFRNLWLTA